MRRLRLLLPLAWRNLWRNSRRTIITIVVVSIGLWSILCFAVLLSAWADSSRDTTVKLMTGEGQIHQMGYSDDPTVAHRLPPPTAALAKVLAGPMVAMHTPRVRVSAIVQSEYKTLPVTLTGVVPAGEAAISILPHQIRQGHYLTSPNDSGIVIGRNLAKRLKTRVGKRVVVMAQGKDGKLAERAFQVVGLFAGPEQAENEFVFTGIHTAQKMTDIGNDISEIVFNAKNDEALPNLIDALKATGPGLDIQSWKTLAPMAYAVNTFFNEFTMMWLWVVFALMAIGIVNTQLMAVFERTREFGLLQALGMRPRLVMFDVALESTLLIGVGIIIGIGIAVASVQAFPNGINLGFLGRGAELVGAGHILYPRIDVGHFALYSVTVWILGVLATLWPARRASKVSPVEAMGRT